jgi:hypothetical protein
VGRGAVLQQASHAGWREALGSPVLVQVETPNSPACEASWLFPFHHTHRAGLPIAPPTIKLTAQGSQALGLRVLALGHQMDRRSAYHYTHVMAGLVPAIPMRKSAALRSIEITGTSPVTTPEGGAVGECEGPMKPQAEPGAGYLSGSPAPIPGSSPGRQ